LCGAADEGAGDRMQPECGVLRVMLLSCGLIVAVIGCNSAHVQQEDSGGLLMPSQRVTSGDGQDVKQIDALLVAVDQLQTISQESLAAARLIGTADLELAEARQALARAERLVRAGKMAYAAMQYQESWESLQAADAALRVAEEAAVRAGLGHIERELAEDYARVLTADTRRKRPVTGIVRVLGGVVNLRDGAGGNFQVVGKAYEGDTLRLLAEAGAWYQVRTQAGLEGWVAKSVVTPEAGF
jgi:Bacterial SH3 domain